MIKYYTWTMHTYVYGSLAIGLMAYEKQFKVWFRIRAQFHLRQWDSNKTFEIGLIWLETSNRNQIKLFLLKLRAIAKGSEKYLAKLMLPHFFNYKIVHSIHCEIPPMNFSTQNRRNARCIMHKWMWGHIWV